MQTFDITVTTTSGSIYDFEDVKETEVMNDGTVFVVSKEDGTIYSFPYTSIEVVQSAPK